MSFDQDFDCSPSNQEFAAMEGFDISVARDSGISNSSLEMLEQHQAKEQARLLQRFRELRQWQQQQQQQLMQQQQQQLNAWQDEQSKVQLLIATQQGAQWSKGLKQGAGDQTGAVLTPPSKPHPFSGKISQKEFMNGDNSHGAAVSLDSGLAASMQDTLKSQSSLPKPVMYIDTTKSHNQNDEDKYTNSELFSNPGSHEDQLEILKGDDPHPAPDWMSDNSDSFIPSRLPPPRPLRGGKNRGSADQLVGLEQLLHTAPAGLLQQVMNLLPVKSRTEAPTSYTDEIELSASPTLPQPGQQSRARKLQFHFPPSVSPAQSSSQTSVSVFQQQSQQQLQQGELKKRQQQQNHMNVIRNMLQGSQNVNFSHMLNGLEQDWRHIPRAMTLTDARMDDRHLPIGADEGEEVNNDEWEDEDEEDDYDSQNITAKEVQNLSRDERPIHGVAGKKSFEQLLEENLRREEAVENQKSAGKLQRKPFLKKGEGISRFNSAPKKPVKKQSRKPDKKPSLMQVNDISREPTRYKNDLEGKQVLDGATKRQPNNSSLKGGKKSTGVKIMDKKVNITKKTSTNSQESLSDKSVAKLTLIHNTALRKMEEQRSQQTNSYKLVKEASTINDNRDSNGIEKTPTSDAKSSKSDDRESRFDELDSLAEFELIEDAVDNISFRSSSSWVQKLLINNKQGQKEILDKLKSVCETKTAGSDAQAETSSGQAKISTETDHRNLIKSDEPSTCSNNNLILNPNSNNNSNIHDEKDAELLNETITESSDEDNDNNKSGQIRNGETSSQSAAVTNSGTVSDPPQSPSKAMPRKVAPFASKFAAANDTLSMLKALSLQAGFLTAGNVPASFRANMISTSKQDFVSTAAPSSSMATDINGFLSSENQSDNQHSYPPYTNSFFESESSFLPKSVSSLTHGGNFTLSSVAHSQNNWLQSKPVIPSIFSSQVPAENFNSTGMNNDAKHATGLIQKKSYDSYNYDLSSEKYSEESDNSEESDSSDECDDDNNDKIKNASIEEDVNTGNRVKNKDSQSGVASPTYFDDESSWVDEDKDNNESEDRSCMKTLGSSSATATTNSSTPPTSKLMSRLFPKLKPKPSAEVEKGNQVLQQASAQPLATTNGLQSQILREKLMELDKEIERFRSENANLETLRREREEGLVKLKQEIENFQREKENELKKLEEFRNEEIKKLKRERKLFDSYQKKVRSMPDKKEREEIDTLKTQLQELQEEIKRKESRWNSSTSRLKDRLSELELENGELKEEIRILEKRRLEWISAQANGKVSGLSNGKVGSGESTLGKSAVSSKQALTYAIRSSTPTKELDTIKSQSSARSKDSISAGISTAALKPAAPTLTSSYNSVNKNNKSSAGSKSSHKTQDGHVSMTHNGVVASTSKTSTLKHGLSAGHTNHLSGEGIPNNSLPVMMENTLPVAAEVSAMPGSLASSMNPTGKSAALVAMERAVIDKGDGLSYSEVKHQDGKVEKTYKTGTKEIHFPNGTVKEISADGQTIVCRLANGDIRQIFPDHRVVYIFAEAQIMQTTFPDGLETFQFKNGQIERRYPDGTVEITFPSKDVKYLFPDGGQEVILTDGTVMQYNTKGERIVEYPSGDREVHTAEYQRREFPDGIVKTVYSDGRHETRFPNGRIRLKDKAGNIIMDQIVYR